MEACNSLKSIEVMIIFSLLTFTFVGPPSVSVNEIKTRAFSEAVFPANLKNQNPINILSK